MSERRKRRGRDPVFKCRICGRYISYDDIPDKVNRYFTPDTHYTTEVTEFEHRACADD